MIPVALYLRMSDSSQETSIPAQRDACRTYAKSHGLRIVAEFTDSGISGDLTEKRAEFQRMIRESASGKWQGILCWDQDRFGRFDALEAGYWLQPLRLAGVWLETIAQGRIDWSDFAGRIVYSVQQEAKHAYLRDLSRNVNRGMLRAAQSGKTMSQPPRGYRLEDGKFIIDEPEAERIREVFRLYLGGLSCREIAVKLNEDAGNRPWSRTTVYQALKNERYTGVFLWGATSESRYSTVANGSIVPASGKGKRVKPPEIRIEQHHPAIVSPADWRKVQLELARRRRVTSPKRHGYQFGLSGLLVCGACGAVLHGRRYRRTNSRYYVCSRSQHSGACRRQPISEASIVELTLTGILRAWGRLEFLAEVSRRAEKLASSPADHRREKLEAQLVAVRKKLERAKSNMLEVDRELLPHVQDGFRKLLEHESAVMQSLEDLKPAPSPEAAIFRIRQLIENLEQLAKRAAKLPPRTLRDAMGKIVKRITVFAKIDPAHKCRHVIKSLEIAVNVEGSDLLKVAGHA